MRIGTWNLGVALSGRDLYVVECAEADLTAAPPDLNRAARAGHCHRTGPQSFESRGDLFRERAASAQLNGRGAQAGADFAKRPDGRDPRRTMIPI